MLSWLKRNRNFLALAAIWIAFELTMSWSAFCHNPDNYSANYESNKEYICIFNGPASLLYRFIINWWSNIFDEPGSYVALFTALLFVSTTALWLSTRKLWEAGERQIKFNRSVAAVQTRNTRRQLALAQQSADAAKTAVETTRAQIRAYLIVPENPDPAISKDEKERIIATITVYNAGQSTAHAITMNYKNSIQSLSLNTITQTNNGFSKLNDIAPQKEIVRKIEIKKVKDDMRVILSKGYLIHVALTFQYEDIFGEKQTNQVMLQALVGYKGVTDTPIKLRPPIF